MSHAYRKRGDLQQQNGKATACPKPNQNPGDRPATRMDYRLGVDAVCSVLAVTPRQAYRMLESGQVPGRKLGNRWLVSESEIRDFLAALPNNGAANAG